ncbi:T9SS type A sorting domain-containing protein [Spirosoma spitsbergense]|uniref:T9SS type A sorting domain-containing protein n=1 Tax=Spirosoma spitsbergense TaxID=431554 RepID=UPI00037CD145|nr:T9SS type A sorting domain-containing protein [Spirosoma spitsbergense]
MKRTLLCLFGSLALTYSALAQRLSPSVLAVGGGSARTSSMTLDWTLGETVVGTERVAGHLYTQGFHQPQLQVMEQQSLTTLDADYRFTVAPNPVTAWLTIAIVTPEVTPLYLALTDLTGRRYNLPVVPANTASTQIDMTAYPAGTYLLRITRDGERALKTYKIIKAQ